MSDPIKSLQWLQTLRENLTHQLHMLEERVRNVGYEQQDKEFLGKADDLRERMLRTISKFNKTMRDIIDLEMPVGDNGPICEGTEYFTKKLTLQRTAALLDRQVEKMSDERANLFIEYGDPFNILQDEEVQAGLDVLASHHEVNENLEQS